MKIIAPGIGDDAVTAAVETLAQKLAKSPEGAAALKNLGTLIASGASEGAEEALESVLQPFLEKLTYNKDAETVLENPELWGEAAYDGLVGAILGVFGSGASQTLGLTTDSDSGHNVDTKTDPRLHSLAAQGEARLLAGEMPTPEQLEALGMSEAEARGAMVMLQLGELDSDAKLDLQSGTSSKADIMEQNRVRGLAYEQQGFSKFKERYLNAEKQVTIKTSSGIRTRVDAIGIDADGRVIINEFKSSATAPLTKNQRVAFEEILKSGGTVAGRGKGLFKRGYPIPAGTKIEIIRPK